MVRMPSATRFEHCWFSDPHGHRTARFADAYRFPTRAAAQEALDYRIGAVDGVLRDMPEVHGFMSPERIAERRYFEGLRKRLDLARIVPEPRG